MLVASICLRAILKNPMWTGAIILSTVLGCNDNLKGLPGAREQQVYKDSFTHFFQRTSGWIAGDGAMSVPPADDSHIDDYEAATGTIPCLFQVRNAAILHDKDHLEHPRTLIGKGPGFKSLFKIEAEDNYWFWPVAGFQSGDVIYVYLYSAKKTGQGGAWGFGRAGSDYFGKLKLPNMEVQAYLGLPSFNGINFGCGFVQSSGGAYTYAFGNKQDSIESKVYVARIRTTNAASNWSFWDGEGWNKDVTKAAVIAKGASTSLSVCKVKEKYILTTSESSVRCDQGKRIQVATSASPTGPFSARKTIFTIDDTLEGHYLFFYMPIAHPEFINERNELLITYCINGCEPCVSSCVNGRGVPDHYRPKAIRIPLKPIDPNL